MDSAFTRLRQHGVHMLYSFFIQPRKTDEDARRKEWILNILLAVSILLGAALSLSAILVAFRAGAVRAAPLWIPIGIFLFFALLLFISRRGAVQSASYALILAYAIPIGYTAYVWGADIPFVLLAYALVIIMASVLISTRFSLIITAIISAYLLTLAHLQIVGAVKTQSYWRMEAFSMADAVVGVLIFIAVAVVAWLSNREIERSLKRARASEQTLREERDQLEETVERRTAEVRQLQMEKISQQYRFIEFGRLASGFFHDLATPLNVVSLHLEQLRAAKLDGIGEVSAHVERALSMSRRIETFLQAIRRQLAHQETIETFSPADELRSVVDMLHHKAQTLGVDMTLNAPAHVHLHGNPIKFHQLFANLISNAIDAYDGSNPEETHAITVTMKEEGRVLSISVQDWGHGIPPENRERIFEPFFTTKCAEKGLGIGLAMSKKIAETDFGGVLVLADTTMGSTFIVRIPYHPPTP